MKKVAKLAVLLITSYLLLVSMSNIFVHAAATNDDAEMRAAWVASTNNINWPSKPGLSIDQQKAEIDVIYDNMVASNLNTVVFQIKPTADAFYPSEYGPWSRFLTGTQGVDPGYDPLEYMVDEAHSRGLEFHAWFNPYRLTMAGQSQDIDSLSSDHPARSHPDWVMKYGTQMYYNPGIPEVQQFIIDGIMEVVNNYHIDAVHMDDYFYPSPIADQQLPDQHTFEQYRGEFDDIGDWRRDNVNNLIKNINGAIKARKPGVEFGISPAGIWRNSSDDPTGSNTNGGAPNYDALFADTRTWIKNEYIDYMTPQIYWSIGFNVAEYKHLVEWWANEVRGTNVDLYIGHADYKLWDNFDTNWYSDTQILEQIQFNKTISEVKGSMHYNYQSFINNEVKTNNLLLNSIYKNKVPSPGEKHIEYVLNGGVGNFPLDAVASGKDYTISTAELTKEGYTFAGWYLDRTLTNKAPAVLENVTSNRSLYAKWEEKVLETKYTVTFNLAGGNDDPAFNTQEVLAGSSFTLPTTIPTKAEHNFLGWYLDENLTNKAPETIANVNENIALHAKWEKVSTPVPDAAKYKVSFDLNDGEGNFIDIFVEKGSTINKPSAVPTRSGYKFSGWFSEKVDGDKIVFPLTVNSDTVLYAHWEKDVTSTGKENNPGNSPSTGDMNSANVQNLFLTLFVLSLTSAFVLSTYKRTKQDNL